MTQLDVCAVVVTYHPNAEVLENLCAVGGQVDALIVVDNGSDEAELAPLRACVRDLGGSLLENGENLGIAKALNQGVRGAQARGSKWVMLFDQDSRATAGFAKAMMSGFAARQGGGGKVAIAVPRYVDRRSGEVLKAPGAVDGRLEAATTSGSLMPVAVFEDAGWFAEELFIDGVDYEYSLRVRQKGYVIVESAGAELLHEPGTPVFHTAFGRRFQSANYSPVRRYYQERNKVLVTRRYGRQFAGFCAGQFLISVKDLVKIVLVEPGKGKKLRFFFRGLWDGLRGRTGRLEA